MEPVQDVGSISSLAKWIAVTMATVGAAACGVCPATTRAEERSPSGKYMARSYSFECGPVPPFNERVGLKLTKDKEFEEIVTVLDAPYSASLNWIGEKALQIAIDCRNSTASACIPTDERNITIRMHQRWRDVQLEYLVGPRLRSLGAGDILKHLGSS